MEENVEKDRTSYEKSTATYLELIDQFENDQVEATKAKLECDYLTGISANMKDLFENRKYSLEYKQFLTSLKDIQQETKKLEDIFGFTTNFIELKDNADVINIEIKFSDTKIVLFSYEKRAKLFALADMQPLHPNFSELQQFLFQSQDTAGFMASVNDYFAMFT